MGDTKGNEHDLFMIRLKLRQTFSNSLLLDFVLRSGKIFFLSFSYLPSSRTLNLNPPGTWCMEYGSSVFLRGKAYVLLNLFI